MNTLETSAPAPPRQGLPLESRMTEVAHALSTAGNSLLAALPSAVRAPADLGRALGLNKDISSRLLGALGKRDPLAVLFYMPGLESLHRVTASARKKSIAAEAVNAWDAAVAAFEILLKDEIGGKHALDSIASAWLPEARERFEMANRQAAYKAMANLLGATCELSIQAALIHPSASDPARLDGVHLAMATGIRRLRPGMPIVLTSTQRTASPNQPSPTLISKTLDGKAVGTVETRMLLDEFCSKPLPEITATEIENNRVYQLVGDDVGVDTACDLAFAEHNPAILTRYATKTGLKGCLTALLEQPSQRLVFDVLIHQDVWPVEPLLCFYRLPPRGCAHPSDPKRAIDRLDLLDSIRSLGLGIRTSRISEAPSYTDALRTVCEQRGWNSDVFRSYRCDIRYPIWGVQYAMVFEDIPVTL